MNTTLKTILLILNLLMLGIGAYWLYKDRTSEPLIVVIGQACVLLTLLLEKQISNISSSRIDNSDLDFDLTSGDNVKSSRIKDSTIKIKTK